MIEQALHMEIIDISAERLDEATKVLASAFADYPLMRAFFKKSESSYPLRVWEAFRICCEARLALGELLKGVVVDGQLVAVACIATPEKKEWPPSLEHTFGQFLQDAGEEAADRFQQYAALTGERSPQEPHFYLIAIGVRPDMQNQGCARALLEHLHQLSENHPTSSGVALDTEIASNVSLYQHFGYEVQAKTKLEKVDIWCMFRPNNK